MTAALRAGLALLALVQVVLASWQAFLPRSFYDDFPTVDLMPPYNEHLMRDFGSASLGIGIVLAAAALWPETRLVIVALVAYLAFALPHLVFHLGHLHGASAADAAFIVSTVTASVVVPLALLALAWARTRRQRGQVTPRER